MIVNQVIAFLSFVTAFFLGTLVFAKNRKHPLNKTFLVFSVFVGLGNVSDFGFSMANNYNLALFWLKVQMTFPLIYLTQFYLILYFTTKLTKVNKKLILSGYVLTIVLSLFCIFGLHFHIIEEGNSWVRPAGFPESKIVPFINLFVTVLTILLLFQGGKFIIFSKDRSRRIQVVLLLLSFFLPTIYSMLRDTILPVFNINIQFPLSVFIILGWLFVAFAIWKYNLFDITPEFAARNIISTIRDGLVLINDEGIVISANKSFIKLSGLEESQLIGYPIDIFFSKCNFTGIDISDQYQKHELKNQQFDYNTNDNGRLILQFSNSNILDKSGKTQGHVCIIADITSQVQIQKELKVQNQEMLSLAHRAGMAEIATGVMHNIGNLMNSLSISAEKIIETLKNSKLRGFFEANKLLVSFIANPVESLANNPQGKLLPQYYDKLAVSLENENNRLMEESSVVFEKVIQIKDAIDIQQEYAKSGSFNELVSITVLMDETLKILETSFVKHDIVVRKRILIDDNYAIMTSRTRLMNILLNIMKNAMESVIQHNIEPKIIEIVISESEKMLHISITDNGTGIAQYNYPQLFKYGFTTKTGGHGFGLHFCANAVKEMEGTIEAKSTGQGKGAEFIISLPKNESIN